MSGSTSMRQRLPLGQIALFLAIALVCSVYIVVNAIGTDAVAAKDRVTVHMEDGGGITPRVPVTYRGVTIGTVDDVRLVDGGGVEVELAIRQDAEVPADTHVVVGQNTPVALKHIDLRPTSEEPPYLTDGDVLGPEDTSRPLALEELLVNLMRLTDNIDPEALSLLSDEVATGLAGTGPELERLGDNSIELIERFTELEPTASNLIDNTLEFLAAGEDTAGRLPELTATLADATEQIRNQTPHGIELARTVPEVTEEVVPLLRELEPSVAVLLSNLVTPAQIVAHRIPALRHGLIVIPDAFGQLSTIGDGDRANFEFVTTQGGTCYFPEERRTPTDTSPKDPELTYHCPSEGPTVRGAANAPRPEGGSGNPVVTSNPETGRTQVPGSEPVRMGSAGGYRELLGDQSWYGVYLNALE
ncbi:MlaD family protein [Haloechinothrix sp. LS1_15]|uniref:MlaD family protein n=1 Tax=Haloechinothrix sp. LS1_15 TaxID=2652248 RepID=UPI002944DE51|nr:MlaD family protein [Haloechinothrix sp. LS1_15]MDV6013756.1 MCE family protein [Haloechinothrix sp. LS1_15]